MTDEQIVASFQSTKANGDFEELVARHLGRVRDFAFRMVLCDATADDIAQDVFLKVFRNLETFRGDSKFTTWLYRIAVNTAKEHVRRGRVTVSIHESDGQVTGPDHDRPERKAIEDELTAKVEQAMAQLSTKLRTAIVLTSIEELPAKEAAEIEGCTTATMHWRVHQARKQLKLLLQGYLTS